MPTVWSSDRQCGKTNSQRSMRDHECSRKSNGSSVLRSEALAALIDLDKSLNLPETPIGHLCNGIKMPAAPVPISLT